MPRRSDCPVSNVLDLVGDKWSLLIVRDLLFFGRRSYSELQSADERVATNILSNRLARLEAHGIISRQRDPEDRRRKLYGLTAAGVDLLPIVLEMILWSSKHDPNTNAHAQLVHRAKHDRENLVRDIRVRLAR
ncbi:MAG: helix-turn-helix domain-containing protein [Pseudomonadota bacterium]